MCVSTGIKIMFIMEPAFELWFWGSIQVVSHRSVILTEGISWLHGFRFSFAHAPPLSRDFLFTKSTIYRPARIFKKWSYV